MLDKILGTGWKTITGAIGWALGHSGVLGLVLKLAGVDTHGVDVNAILQAIGSALAAIGLAHKVQRVDWNALIAAIKAAADAYSSQSGGTSS